MKPDVRIINQPSSWPTCNAAPSSAEIEMDFARELLALEAEYKLETEQLEIESMGWIPLEPGAYLHLGNELIPTVQIVGIATANCSGTNILWLTL